MQACEQFLASRSEFRLVDTRMARVYVIEKEPNVFMVIVSTREW